MSIKLMVLRWIHWRIQRLIWQCHEEKLLSDYRASIESGAEDTLLRYRVRSIYGEHSPEWKSIGVLVRLQAFKQRNRGKHGTN